MTSSLYSTLQNLLSTSFPFWSYMVHLSVAALLVLLQNVFSVSKTLDPYFKFLNEFLASMTWLVWSLENTVVGFMWSRTSGLMILWIRLLLGPLVLRRAYCNPCVILYDYLFNRQSWKNRRECLLYLLAELLAVPASLALAMTMWNFLADYGLSHDHAHFLQEKPEYFLSVPNFTGFTIETLVSFLMFMPGMVFSQSLRSTILEALFIVILVFLFGPLTGACMNPIVALSLLLMWHYGDTDPTTVAVHLFIFWLGPLVGTVIAVGVAKLTFGKQHVE